MKNLLTFIVILVFCCAAYGQTKSANPSDSAKVGFLALDGKIYRQEDLAGKIVVMNFWFSNCLPCLKEIPELNEIVAEYKDNKDVVFLGLATDGKLQLNKFLKKKPFAYTIIPDAAQIMLRFSEPDKNGRIEIKFPTHLIVSREGKIILRETGIKGVAAVKKELERQTASEKNEKMK